MSDEIRDSNDADLRPEPIPVEELENRISRLSERARRLFYAIPDVEGRNNLCRLCASGVLSDSDQESASARDVPERRG